MTHRSQSTSILRYSLRNAYRDADRFLARPGRKQARKHVRDARDFNKIKTQAIIEFLFLQHKAPKEIHAILTETLASFLPGLAKDLSAPLYISYLVFFSVLPSRLQTLPPVTRREYS